MTYKFLFLIIVLSLLSCSSGKQSGEDTGQQQEGAETQRTADTRSDLKAGDEKGSTLEIRYKDRSRNLPLTLEAKGFRLNDAEIAWFVNRNPVQSTSTYQLTIQNLNKGDQVQAKAMLRDRNIFSNTIVIDNAPPAISSIKIMPEVFQPGDTLRVDAAGTDPDGDKVTFTYAWIINGEPAGTEQHLKASLKRGDSFSVTVTPYDGVAYGRPIILERELRNLPPMIGEQQNVFFDGQTLTCTITANDPDGDTVSYALKDEPKGMTIGKDTGVLTYNVPAEAFGKISFTVSVTDGQGGESAKEFHLDVTSRTEQ
jgi:hypothetical protein